MPRAPRGSGLPRRPRAEATTPRDSAGSRSTEMLARTVRAGRTEVPAPSVSQEPAVRHEGLATASRFDIFIIDTGWNSPARKVLQDNFRLFRDLQKENPI